jgi:hypothetical protein
VWRTKRSSPPIKPGVRSWSQTSRRQPMLLSCALCPWSIQPATAPRRPLSHEPAAMARIAAAMTSKRLIGSTPSWRSAPKWRSFKRLPERQLRMLVSDIASLPLGRKIGLLIASPIGWGAPSQSVGRPARDRSAAVLWK